MNNPQIRTIAIVTTLLTCFGFCQCKTKKIESTEKILMGGSPCLYDTFLIPAKIIKADTSGNDYVFITVEVKPNTRETDTLLLHREPPYHAITKKDYLQSGIYPGDHIQCSFYKIKSGDCDPSIFWFAWKRYAAKSNASSQGKEAYAPVSSY